MTDADVELLTGSGSDIELVLGYRRGGDIHVLASAQAGRVSLSRGGVHE